MRALLDTHVFLWWISGSPKLSEVAQEAIADEHNEVVFSVVSAWEIVIKASLGKLELPDTPENFLTGQLSRNDMEVLPMYLRHALHVHALPDHHRDPFDRLLVAQAIIEDVPLVSADPQITRYPVDLLW